ncbi:Uncharacterised protein [Bordetella pertussis]|nr:Uncharacterised protein [Bordetella pertussis]
MRRRGRCLAHGMNCLVCRQSGHPAALHFSP